MGAEEQAAVTITGVSQAAFPDHNVQYQFRTENNGGQVSSGILFFLPPPSFFAFQNLERNRPPFFLSRARAKFCARYNSRWQKSLFVLRHQVTYRVVQVTDDQLEASADGSGAVSVVSTAAFAGTPQAVAQVSKQERGTAADVLVRWRRRGNETDFKTNSCNLPRGSNTLPCLWS